MMHVFVSTFAMILHNYLLMLHCFVLLLFETAIQRLVKQHQQLIKYDTFITILLLS
jgi:hypothetical protein